MIGVSARCAAAFGTVLLGGLYVCHRAWPIPLRGTSIRARRVSPGGPEGTGRPQVEGVIVTDSEVSRLLTVSQRRVDGIAVVTAVGEIDINSAPELRTVLDAAVGPASDTIVDLSGVQFLGSVGLSVLLAAVEQADPGRVRVVASLQARRPIEVTGLDQVLDLYDTVESALAAS